MEETKGNGESPKVENPQSYIPIEGQVNFCTPFQAPALPPYFVERSEVSNKVKSSLLEKTSITGALVISAIHGLGGIGKSTLVAALVRHPDIRTRFPDGTLWATLGQQPDVLSLLTSWIQALGDSKFSPTNIDAASRQLCSLLDKKAVLLVVDDVWDADHALPFRIGGSQCRVLVTTRNADIARVIDATLYNLDVMTEKQALALLEGHINRKINNDEQAKVLAKAVEYLPLALELAAAQVTDGIPFSELIENLEEEIGRLDVLDLPGFEEATNEITRKKLSLLASFNLSLRRLSAEKLQKFAWLGVVPEDVTLTQKMVTTLWETNLWEARDTLRYLRNKALLLKDIPLADGTATYRLHDLVHDRSRLLLTSPLEPEREEDLPGLGLTLQEAHLVLLNRYRKCTEDGLWYQFPDDGYIHSYLAWHMEQAGCEEEIHKLLKEETDEGKNGWYQARDCLGQTAGYLADVTRAWKLAEEAFIKLTLIIGFMLIKHCDWQYLKVLMFETVLDQISHRYIGLQIRYALITASLNSLAKNIPPTLVAALVKKEIWTVTQGLAYARQTPEPSQKAEALIRLTPHLPESEQELIQKEALTIALAIQHPEERGKALAKLAPYQPKSIQEKVLTAVQAINTDYWKGKAIVRLAPHLPESLARNMLSAVQTIDHEYIQCYTLTKIWSFLPTLELEKMTQNLQARLIKKVCVLLNSVEGCELEYDINEDYKTRNKFKPINSYINLIFNLPKPFQKTTINQLLEIFDVMEQNISRLLPDRLYTQLANYLSEEQLEEVRLIFSKAERTKPQETHRLLFRQFMRLRLSLPESLNIEIQENFINSFVCDTRQTSGGKTWKEELDKLKAGLEVQLEKLENLEEKLNQPEIEQSIEQDLAITEDESQQAEVLAKVWNIAVESERVEALTRLVPYLSKALLPEVLVGVQKIQDKTEQVQVLVNFAPYLSEALRKETLEQVQTVKNENVRAEMFIDLASYLSESLLDQLLEALPMIEDESKRGKTLIELAPHLPESLLNQALKIARAIQENFSREQILLKIIPRLPESLQHTVMNDLLATILEADFKAEKLAELGCQLPKPLNMSVVKDALALTKEIADVQEKEKLLKKLIPYLSNSQLKSILSLVKNSENKYLHALTIVYLAPQFNQLLLEEGLEATQNIHKIEGFNSKYNSESETEIQNQKAEILTGLAPYLSELLLNKALEIASEINNFSKVNVLIGLAPYISESLIEKIFREEIFYQDKEEFLTMAFTQLASYFPQSLTNEALTVAQNTKSKWNKLKIIKVLIQHNLRSAQLLREAVVTANQIEIEEGQAGAMIEIVSYISDEQKIEVIKKVLTNENKKSRAAQIKILAPYIATISSDTLHLVWYDTLHFLARRSRKDLLSDLCALTPVIKSLGGTRAIEETAYAIQDVGRWWS